MCYGIAPPPASVGTAYGLWTGKRQESIAEMMTGKAEVFAEKSEDFASSFEAVVKIFREALKAVL